MNESYEIIYIVTAIHDNIIHNIKITTDEDDAVVAAMQHWVKNNPEDSLDNLSRDKLMEYVEKGYIKNKKMDIENLQLEVILEYMDDIDMEIYDMTNVNNKTSCIYFNNSPLYQIEKIKKPKNL